MQFTGIWTDGDSVKLHWAEPRSGGMDKHEWPCAQKPTPRLINALQAFVPYVVDLVGLPEEWKKDAVIRSIAPKTEEKTGARGLTVYLMRTIEAAKNRSVGLNTPYMSAPPAEYNGDGKGYLSPAIVKLIQQAEEAAEEFLNGERVQLELKSEDGAALGKTKGTTDEPRSTGKPVDASAGKAVPRKGKKKPPTAYAIHGMLAARGHEVPVAVIEGWSNEQREQAYAYADAFNDPTILEKDQPNVPLFVHEAGAAEVWTQKGGPVLVGDVAAKEIQAAAARGAHVQ